MIRLIFRDLVHHARVWLGVLAVTTASGFVAAVTAGLIETGSVHGGRVADGLASSASAVIMFSAVTALIVLSSSAELTVMLQQRSYALWQLVGVQPGRITTIVCVQLAVVACAGGAIGFAVAVPLFEPLFRFVFRSWEQMAGISLHLGVGSFSAVLGGIVLIAVLGGWRGARRAGRVEPIVALRDVEPRTGRIRWVRVLLVLATLIAVISLIAALDPEESLSSLSGKAILVVPLISAVFAAAGPFLYPLILSAWAGLVPKRASATWYLARNSARYRLSLSSAAIGPLMVAVALSGGLYSVGATLGAEQVQRTGVQTSFTLEPEGVVLLLGGPLLLSGIAAAATVFMSGQAREREFALVQAAGSTRSAVILAAVWEAVIYSVTATILGALAILFGVGAVANALGLPAPSVDLAAIGLISSAGFVLMLLATVLPTVFAVRGSIPRTLAVE